MKRPKNQCRSRPNTLVGLSAMLLGIWLRRWWPWLVIALFVLAALLYLWAAGGTPVKVGTFNIQDYPKSGGQAAGAVELIESLEVDVVGLQEITRPDVLDRNVELYLGDPWQVVHVDQEVFRRVAILYDASKMELVDSWSHDETAIYEGGRATLEARFRLPSGRDEYLRVFALHLKAYSEGLPVRRRQLRAIEPVVRSAVDSGDSVVVVGDFNTTELADRVHLSRFAEATGLEWTTEELDCTAYWDREFTCSASRLDHILATDSANVVAARGACETVGCEPGDRCPTYVEMVSDHCPVTAEF